MLCVSPCVILPLSVWLQFVTLALVLLLPLLISMDASDPVGGIAADDLGTFVYISNDVLGADDGIKDQEPGDVYQEHNYKSFPILTVKHPCLFASVDMYVCVALSIIVCV